MPDLKLNQLELKLLNMKGLKGLLNKRGLKLNKKDLNLSNMRDLELSIARDSELLNMRDSELLNMRDWELLNLRDWELLNMRDSELLNLRDWELLNKTNLTEGLEKNLKWVELEQILWG